VVRARGSARQHEVRQAGARALPVGLLLLAQHREAQRARAGRAAGGRAAASVALFGEFQHDVVTLGRRAPVAVDAARAEQPLVENALQQRLRVLEQVARGLALSRVVEDLRVDALQLPLLVAEMATRWPLSVSAAESFTTFAANTSDGTT
jgi:hypothetical protein